MWHFRDSDILGGMFMSRHLIFVYLYLSILHGMLHSSQMAAIPVSLPEIDVEGFVFPAVASPPSSGESLFLGGAGIRGLEIDGKFVKFTAIGVYLEESAVESLAGEWKGKTEEELAGSLEFYRDIFTGPFEKFTQITMILPLTGQQYSEKVAENCEEYLKSIGAFTEAESKALEKFKEIFASESFSHGSSVFFTHSTSGSLLIAFSKDTSPPAENAAAIENGRVSEAVLESIIGEKGVSPAAKQSLAARVASILQLCR